MRTLYARYNRINILATIAIFLIASVAFYFSVNFVQLKQVDGDLEIEEEEVMLYVKQYKELPKTFSVPEQIIQFEKIKGPFRKRYFRRTDLKDAKGHLEDFRQLIFGIEAGGGWYKVTVSKSLEETDHLIKSISWITTCTILLILLVSFVINRFVLKQLWKPFFQSLSMLKEFRIDKEQPINFPSTSIEEFGLMIETLERTTKQAQIDYLSLKAFSENASHEIQTPIAIIQSKLDLLIQDEALTEQQSKSLQAIYEAIQRLTRLNTSLLLSVKIDNNQFRQLDNISLKASIQERLTDFRELWLAQGIEVSYLLDDISISMNVELWEVLINNLLSNATRHNHKHGRITILLTATSLVVANSGEAVPLDQEKIFQRFYKPSQSAGNNGLGLSIIKQICDVSELKVSYGFKQAIHSFTIEW